MFPTHSSAALGKAVVIPVSVLCMGLSHVCFAYQVDEANATAVTRTCSLGSQPLEPMLGVTSSGIRVCQVRHGEFTGQDRQLLPDDLPLSCSGTSDSILGYRLRPS